MSFKSRYKQVSLFNLEELTRPDTKINRLHCEQHPHWSLSVDWRPGRWDPMSNAPSVGSRILCIRGRDKNGNLFEEMHYACGGGEEQPPFDGWFIPAGPNHFTQVFPVEWQPMSADPYEPESKSSYV